jgi:hypothetical protein
MELAPFIHSLLYQGNVTVKSDPAIANYTDRAEVINILETYYREDILDMPANAPAFVPDAAVWAAHYFYQAIMLTVTREAGEELIHERIVDFPNEKTAGVIYSADLVLRHLPSLFDLAKGLAPADVLVKKLKQTAATWPLSSVGIELDEIPGDETILADSFLRQLYIDRIIQLKDKKRIQGPQAIKAISETTGDYTAIIWPDLVTELKPTANGN